MADSTVFIHLDSNKSKMEKILVSLAIKQLYISQIGYLEILSGASENSKVYVRKILNSFQLLEFDAKAAKVASKLAMQYRVGSKQHKDFLIASIAVANKIPLLTENTKGFTDKELQIIPYRIQ